MAKRRKKDHLIRLSTSPNTYVSDDDDMWGSYERRRAKRFTHREAHDNVDYWRSHGHDAVVIRLVK